MRADGFLHTRPLAAAAPADSYIDSYTDSYGVVRTKCFPVIIYFGFLSSWIIVSIS